MTDELKPVRCGCGGEVVVKCLPKDSKPYLIYCDKCFTASWCYRTEDEAITAWNRAMGKGDDLSPVERTAKVVGKARDVNGNRWGKCGDCGSLVFSHYCPVCGARLEWE